MINNLTQKQHQIIDGILISDGYISNKHGKTSSLTIGQREDRKDFIELIAEELKFEYSIYHIVPKSNWKSKVKNPEFRYASRSYEFLNFYKDRWYKNNKKVIPDDFIICPVSLLYWYLGDGSFHKRSQTIRLSTCCFTKQQVENLICKFKDIKIFCNISKRNEIYVMKRCSQMFFDYIGSCPLSSFNYKWPQDCIKLRHEFNNENKEQIIKLYKETNHTTRTLSKIFKFSSVAIAKLIKSNLDEKEYALLKYQKMINRNLKNDSKN